jgi:opacity protein-like surface antigen
MLSAGVYGGTCERDVKYKGGVVMPLETQKAVLYLGVDIMPWATLFVGGGTANHEFGGVAADDSSFVVEAGLLIGVIDHEILDPTLFEDRLRVNVGASGSYTDADRFGDTLWWQELTAFATVSIVNDTTGNTFFNPNSIALYMGPYFSYIQSSDIEAEETLGIMAGVEVFVSESISFDIGIRDLDSTAIEGGLHIRF